MLDQIKKFLRLPYLYILIVVASVYKIVSLIISGSAKSKHRSIVLLVSRPQDIELLINLHERAQHYENLSVTIWLLKKCVTRFPDVIDVLTQNGMAVDQLVSHNKIFTIIGKLTQTNGFLSTVESTSGKHKFPYILTKLANAAGVSTYSLQHGFENIGLSYRDEMYGPDVTFASRTIFTWGPIAELPSWVDKNTLKKAVAVGCPKKFDVLQNTSSADEARPIIGVFDNLHWSRYSEDYQNAFWSDFQEIAAHNKRFQFILKSHPVSIRNRDETTLSFLRNLENIDIAELIDERSVLTTSWLLSKAVGIITTPSTIAIDGALAKIPVAVTKYGLDLSYYQPLSLLDNVKDWQIFLDQLTDKLATSQIQLTSKHFLDRVLVPGDPTTKILSIMTKENVT